MLPPGLPDKLINVRKLDIADTRSASRQIASAIVAAIADGELDPGDPLPSRRDLQAHFGVANATIQAALDRLKAEGTVTGHQGRGVFVNPDVAPMSMGTLVSRLDTAIDQAQRDAEAGLIRVEDPVGGCVGMPVPVLVARTLIRRCQGDRRIVAALSTPLPDEHSPGGIALCELAASYATVRRHRNG